jgi:hypothetical protein
MSSGNLLRDFFRQKLHKAKPADVDWGAKRDAWIVAVNDLYHTIEDGYLREPQAGVTLTRQDKSVKENLIGEYVIPELVLQVADEQVVFSPKGANIVGAKGRIDVHGDRDDATILWFGDRWSIVASRTPALRLEPLSAESLATMLQRIMRP